MSSEPYTPTSEEMRTDYIMAYDERGGSQLLAGAAFDRGIAKIRADTLREAADDINARVNSQGLIDAVDRWGGYYGGIRTAMQNEETALRLRAKEIEREARDE